MAPDGVGALGAAAGLALSVAIVAAGCQASTAAPTAQDAKQFLDEVDAKFNLLYLDANRAGWVAQTFITVDSEAMDARATQAVSDASSLFAKQADMLELRNKIDSKIKELEGQLKIDQGRLEAPLIAKLRDIVQEIGKEQGFTMILDRSTPGLVYTREALDITNQVTARFNKKKG